MAHNYNHQINTRLRGTVAMKNLLLVIISIALISCDGASNKKNIKTCIELGVKKDIAESECRDFEDMEKKIRQITTEEIDKKQNLLEQAEIINKRFENYTKSQFLFKAEVAIDLDSKTSKRLYTSHKVTNKPTFAHHAEIRDKRTNPHIYVDGRKWRINEENYEFLTPSFSGNYELRSDKTKNKLFTQFFKECSVVPRCKFSLVGVVDAIKPTVDESNVDDEWEGWIDVEDFSFNKFIHTNPKKQDIEDYVVQEIYRKRNSGYKLYEGYITKAINEYIYKS